MELAHHEVLSGPEADSVKRDFCQLISDPVCLGKVKDFKKGEHRVDDFWLDDILKDRPRSDPTRKMVWAILILSHGQASVERGFNVNKEMLVENQTDSSLIALRAVYDHMKNIGVSVENFLVSKSLINSVRAARSRYQYSLDDQKAEKATKEESEAAKKKRIRDQLEEKMEERKKMNKETVQLDKEIEILKQHTNGIFCDIMF